MKLKKVLAIVICAAMLVTGVIGCNSDTQETPPEEDIINGEEENQSQSQTQSEPGIDYEAAFATFAPDTVMINVGDSTVTWEYLFFYLRGNINEVISYFGGLPGWDEELSQGLTFADYIKISTVSNLLEGKVIEYGATLLGVTLSEEDIQEIQDYFYEVAERFGGEEEFLRIIWEEDGCHSRELFDRIVGVSRLIDAIFSELYGANGDMITYDELAEHTALDGYIMTKHILRLHPEDDDESDSDRDSASAREEIEAILKELNEFDGEDFEEFFDDLMYRHSEDTGLVTNPMGYLFQVGDMVQEYYDAAVELEIGQLSEIIETDFGYHIIYRIPINFDVIPASGYMNSDYRTLREMVMMDLFSVTFEAWRNSLEIEYTDDFESMDLSEIFVVQ